MEGDDGSVQIFFSFSLGKFYFRTFFRVSFAGCRIGFYLTAIEEEWMGKSMPAYLQICSLFEIFCMKKLLSIFDLKRKTH